MTCMNCGSTAVQPNGWCSACGQPASPPQPTAWPAPPQQPSWATPTQQQSWAAPTQQQSWAAPAPSEWNAPPKHDELTPPRDETPRLQQGEWQAQHAAHQGQWETQQQEQWSAQPGQWETPQQGQQAAHQAQWETQQQEQWAAQPGQWAPPQGHEQPSWETAQQDRGVPPEQPTWATDATSTFGVSSLPATTYQSPPAHQPPPTDATVVGGLPPYMQQPAPSSYANPPALDATVVGGLPAYPQQQPPPQPAPPMDATAVGAYPQQQPAPGSHAGYPQQPGFNQPPYMVSNQAPQAAAVHRSGNPFSIVAFVLAGISLLLFPALVGPLGIIFGAVALFRRERLGRLALILAFVGLIGGVALGMAVNSLL